MPDGPVGFNAGAIVKRCGYGHHYYTGQTCPMCEYFGREALARARGDSRDG